MRELIKIGKKYFILLFGLCGWSLWFYVILGAIENNGFNYLDFNHYNEMILEFFLIFIMVVIFTGIFLNEIIKDLVIK